MAGGENAYNQLLAAKRQRGKGSLESLQRSIWLHIRAVEASLKRAMADDDSNMVLRCSHTIAQLAAAYRGVYVDSEFEARLQRVEQGVDGNSREPSARKRG